MKDWEDDPDEPAPPMTGERLAGIIVIVVIFLIVIFVGQ
jgi:hypothetical protein